MTAVETAFAQTLVAERETISRFVELLEREQASLRHGRTDELIELAAGKESLAASLETLGAERRGILAAQGHSGDRHGIEAWCERHPDEREAADSWQAILALAAQARQLQRVNGELIELHLHYNAKALEALQGGRRSLDLYGPDGQAKTASNQSIDHRA